MSRERYRDCCRRIQHRRSGLPHHAGAPFRARRIWLDRSDSWFYLPGMLPRRQCSLHKPPSAAHPRTARRRGVLQGRQIHVLLLRREPRLPRCATWVVFWLRQLMSAYDQACSFRSFTCRNTGQTKRTSPPHSPPPSSPSATPPRFLDGSAQATSPTGLGASISSRPPPSSQAWPA